MSTLRVEPSGQGDLIPCESCGDKSQHVSGYVLAGNGETAYLVHWTHGRVLEHGAHFDLLVPTQDRVLGVSVEFRLTDDGPGFMVIDAGGREFLRGFPDAAPLTRREVVDTPLAKSIFETLDAIWLQDDRIRELHGDVA